MRISNGQQWLAPLWCQGVEWFCARVASAERIRRTTLVVLAVVFVLQIIAAFSASGGMTVFGTALGGDFPCFYIGGLILRNYGSARLYDFDLQNSLLHSILAAFPEGVSLPNNLPPIASALFVPFSLLPYPAAYFIWLIAAGGAYVLSLKLIGIGNRVRVEALLLALTFEPFLLEAWIGGQTSTFFLLPIVAGLVLHARGAFVWSGFLIGLCAVKPSLLVLIVPCLLAGSGRLRTGTGLGMGLLTVTGACLLTSGLDVFVAYSEQIFRFVSGGPLSHVLVRTSKFVDLRSFIDLLTGVNSSFSVVLAGCFSLAGLIYLMRLWYAAGNDRSAVSALWSATLLWTPLLNLHFGIYDSILIIPAVVLMLDSRTSEREGGMSTGQKGILCALWISPWITHIFAVHAGIQLYSLAILAAALYQTSRASGQVWSNRKV